MKSLEFAIPLVFQIENSHLVDSLPYIDEYTEADEKMVKSLIDEELVRMDKNPSEYILMFEKEIKKDMEIMPLGEFKLLRKIPECDEEYMECARNNEVLIEYLEAKKINLEIAQEFSVECWGKHLQDLEAYEKKIEFDLAQLASKNLEINKSRKTTQESAGSKLKTLEGEWKMLLGKNLSLHKKLQEKQADLSKLIQ